MGFLKRLFGSVDTNDGAAQQAPARQTRERRDIDASSLAERLKLAPPPFLLDVREPQEFAAGHIAGATLIPLGELAQRAGELPAGREIVCVCHSGSRSSAATRHLAGAGYNVTNLSGGMIGWMRARLPIER